jgi:hypothetical protein
MPIYLHQEGMKLSDKIQLSDTRAKTVTPLAYERLQKMVKAAPEITKEIESHPNLEETIFSTRTPRGLRAALSGRGAESIQFAYTSPADYDKKEGFDYVYLPPYDVVKELWKMFRYNENPMKSLFHELQHIEQLKKWGGADSKIWSKYLSVSDNNIKDKNYMKQKGEIEARRVAQKKFQEIIGERPQVKQKSSWLI